MTRESLANKDRIDLTKRCVTRVLAGMVARFASLAAGLTTVRSANTDVFTFVVSVTRFLASMGSDIRSASVLSNVNIYVSP